jgi:transglutaminase-like putative cysteine protease
VLVAAGLGCVSAARLRSGWLVGTVGVAGAAVYSLAAVFAPVWRTDGLGTPAMFAKATRDGWARMLTVGLPADPDPDLLLLPALVVWTAAFVAVMLTVRTDAVLAPVAPPVGGFAVALLFVAPRGRELIPLAGALALSALVLGVVRAARLAVRGRVSAVAVHADPDQGSADGSGPTPSRGPRAGSRLPHAAAGKLAVGLPLVLVVALLGTAAGKYLPIADGDDRRDARNYYHPEVDVSTVLNPLVQIKADRRADNSRDLFTIQVSGVNGRVKADRIRVLTLTDFDGASWTNGGAFVRSGETLPTGNSVVEPSAVPTIQTNLKVTVMDDSALFLPTIGAPVGVQGATFGYAYQPASDVLAATETLKSGDEYELSALVPAPSKAQLDAAERVPSDEANRFAYLPPEGSEELADIAFQFTAEAGDSAYAQLLAIQEALRDTDTYPVDLNARPGHSYGALQLFLKGGDADTHGYVEQFVTAFTVLARALGFPTRIAVGYLLEKDDTDDGIYTVTSRQAFAWPEVALDGIGWVSFDPTVIEELGRELPPDAEGAPGGNQGAPREDPWPCQRSNGPSWTRPVAPGGGRVRGRPRHDNAAPVCPARGGPRHPARHHRGGNGDGGGVDAARPTSGQGERRLAGVRDRLSERGVSRYQSADRDGSGGTDQDGPRRRRGGTGREPRPGGRLGVVRHRRAP